MSDTTAPSIPGQPVIGDPTPTGVRLSWPASTDASGIAAYRVYNKGVLAATGSLQTPALATTTLPVSMVCSATCYAAGTWVAAGANGTTYYILTSPAGASGTWTRQTTPAGTVAMTCIVYGTDRFIGVAGGAYTVFSYDAVSWFRIAAPKNLYHIAYGNGLFVALDNVAGECLTSPDGNTWTARTMPAPAGAWSKVYYGGNTFVAIGGAAATTSCATSPDGITWTEQAMPSGSWQAARYGAGMWVALSSTTAAASSPDGITWTSRTCTTAGPWAGILRLNNGFLAINLGIGAGSLSADGITWQNGTRQYSGQGTPAYDGTGRYMLGNSALAGSTLVTGPGLLPVAASCQVPFPQSTPASLTVTAVDPAGNESAPSPAAVPDTTPPTVPGRPAPSGGTGTQVTLTWAGSADAGQILGYTIYRDNGTPTLSGAETPAPAPTTMPTPAAWNTVAHGNDTFVALAGTVGSSAAVSRDGITWTTSPMPNNGVWTAIGYHPVDGFVGVSSQSALAATSPDGITWIQRSMPGNHAWSGIGRSSTTWAAVSNDPYAATSPDGVIWTERNLPATTAWSSVAWGNNTFVTVGGGTNAATAAAAGTSWAPRDLTLSRAWKSVTFGNGLFVAVGYASALAVTSPDGITWTQRNLPASLNWHQVCFTPPGTFVAVATGTDIAAISHDGITWTQIAMPSIGNWRGVTAGRRTLLAVANGTVNAARTVLVARTTATITGLTGSATGHSFTIEAFDTSGNPSARSPSGVYGGSIAWPDPITIAAGTGAPKATGTYGPPPATPNPVTVPVVTAAPTATKKPANTAASPNPLTVKITVTAPTVKFVAENPHRSGRGGRIQADAALTGHGTRWWKSGRSKITAYARLRAQQGIGRIIRIDAYARLHLDPGLAQHRGAGSPCIGRPADPEDAGRAGGSLHGRGDGQSGIDDRYTRITGEASMHVQRGVPGPPPEMHAGDGGQITGEGQLLFDTAAQKRPEEITVDIRLDQPAVVVDGGTAVEDYLMLTAFGDVTVTVTG